MDWIRENKTLASILGVIAAGVLGLGYLLYEAWGAYSTAKDEYLALGGQVAQIKGMALAPTEQNLKAKQALVEEYGSNVTKLDGALKFLQPALPPTKQADFQAKLKDRIGQIKSLAQSQKVSLPADFALGFSDYLVALPASDATATNLSAYLDGVEAIVSCAINSGVKSIDLLERDPIPNEKEVAPTRTVRPGGQPGRGPTPSPAAGITEKRSVSLVITLDQGTLQNFLSKLANPVDMKIKPEADQSIFTSVRVLRIENQAKEGPVRRKMASTSTSGTDFSTGGDATAKADGASDDKSLAPPAPSSPDSVPVIGQEVLKSQMEIDIVHFIDAAPPSSVR
jgi:hypothetical protein